MLPCAELAEFIEHFWWVSWELARPFRVQTLPHPTVHLTFEVPGRRAVLGGPATRLFSRVLSGRGWVFGVKFRPAMASCWWAGARGWVDRRIALARVAPDSVAWRRDVFSAASFDERLERTERELLQRTHEDDDVAHQVRDAVNVLETEHATIRIEALASRQGLTSRTLERRFRRALGQPPKQVLQRYRLIAAAERLKRRDTTIARVAQELGYFDQAHFVKDFRRTLGVTPSIFSRVTSSPER